jgi:hypothetical protein
MKLMMTSAFETSPNISMICCGCATLGGRHVAILEALLRDVSDPKAANAP